MENKYYTPAIEDIYVGYECELFVHKGDYNNRWVPFTLTPFVCKGQITSMSSSGNWRDLIRTPYLTKEQIETEGWKIKTEYTGKFRFVFEKGNSWLAWNPEENMMTIMPIDPSKEFYEHNVRYAGGCPSINEFRQITKLLGI